MKQIKAEWILCPICGNKTRTMIREDTELRNFPLYCPKCKKETIINVQDMLAEYGTFKMANNIAFNKLNAPDLGMIVAGAIISAIGMLVGSLWNKKRHNQKK